MSSLNIIVSGAGCTVFRCGCVLRWGVLAYFAYIRINNRSLLLVNNKIILILWHFVKVNRRLPQLVT
jgi:hypothetical protein